MANRYMVRNFMTLEKGPVQLYGRAAIGATGAPTLNAVQSQGILSIARSGVGAYTITYGGPTGTDTYRRLLGFEYISVSASGSTAVSCDVISTAAASGTMAIVFNSAAKTPVELANGEDLRFTVTLSNSTAV